MSLTVEKVKKKVNVCLADQSQLAGHIYLSPISERGVGEQTLLEALTSEEKFIPFQTTEGEFSFLNQRQIAWVATLIEASGTDPHIPAEWRTVKVFMRDGKLFRGEVPMAMPEGRRRLSDVLNSTQGFLVIRDDKREIFVNLDFVTRVL